MLLMGVQQPRLSIWRIMTNLNINFEVSNFVAKVLSTPDYGSVYPYDRVTMPNGMNFIIRAEYDRQADWTTQTFEGELSLMMGRDWSLPKNSMGFGFRCDRGTVTYLGYISPSDWMGRIHPEYRTTRAKLTRFAEAIAEANKLPIDLRLPSVAIMQGVGAK